MMEEWAEPKPPPSWFRAGKNTPLRQIENVKKGLHPTGWPLDPEITKAKCGTCRHRFTHVRPSGRRFEKCDLTFETRGPGSDIRLSWRACACYEPRTEYRMVDEQGTT